MREHGCLELHGRVDDRFKIRGQWGSLAEIEAALRVKSELLAARLRARALAALIAR